MSFHDLSLTLIAFISELLGTISGFGSSTFFVPTAVLFESFKFVLALTAILHCFGNLSRIYLFREHFEWKTFAQLVVPSVLFTGLGALLTAHITTELIRTCLGGVLILVSLISFLKTSQKRVPGWFALPLSALSGFSTGLVGTGGAIRGLALTMLGIEKNSFVSISAAVDIGGDLLRAIIYIRNGFMDWSQWFYIPLLGVAAWAGAKVGKFFLARINQAQFDKIVAVFIALSGLLMLFE